MFWEKHEVVDGRLVPLEPGREEAVITISSEPPFIHVREDVEVNEAAKIMITAVDQWMAGMHGTKVEALLNEIAELKARVAELEGRA